MNKTVDVKMRGNFQYFRNFKIFHVWLACSTLHSSRKSLIGAKRLNSDNFLQVGKLVLHKLCQNKHFSTAGRISPNSKRKTFSCSYHSFQPLSWLIKVSFSFSLPRFFSCQPCNLVALYSSSFLAGDLQCCSFEINT